MLNLPAEHCAKVQCSVFPMTPETPVGVHGAFSAWSRDCGTALTHFAARSIQTRCPSSQIIDSTLTKGMPMKPTLRFQSCLPYRKAYKPARKFKPGRPSPAISFRPAPTSPQPPKLEAPAT